MCSSFTIYKKDGDEYGNFYVEKIKKEAELTAP